jgi:DDE superfamily endonuclease
MSGSLLATRRVGHVIFMVWNSCVDVLNLQLMTKQMNKSNFLYVTDNKSHITGPFIAHCISNNVVLKILPPHSLHLTQPLDLALFNLLKTAMSAELSHIIYTDINRVTKVGWLSAYIIACTSAFSTHNIHSGLFPINPSKVLNI